MFEDANPHLKRVETEATERTDDLKSQFEDRLTAFTCDVHDDLAYALRYIKRYQDALRSLHATDPLAHHVKVLYDKYGLTSYNLDNRVSR